MDNKKINYIQLINGFYNIGAPHILGSVATSLALAVLHKLNALYFPESAPISNPEITSLSGISIYKLSRARESLNTYTYNGKWVFRYTASENQGAGIYEINYEILMNPFVKITQELPNDYPSITQELSSDSPNVTQELPKSYPSFNQEQPLDSPNVTQELPGSPSFFSKNAHDLRPTIPTIPTIPTEQTEQKNTNPTQRVARGNVFDFVKSSSISNLGEGIKRKRKTDTEIEELKN
ncbi:MAG: hypothetical protein QG591_2673, partial [Planctomycetota bacterium]|nr:hypothetical protein [Planctomycetota bacterium]